MRLIRLLVLVVGGVVVGLGTAAAVIPDVVIAAGRQLVSPAGLYAAAAFRAGVGLVLIRAARESQAPRILRAIGAVVLVSALATPLLGVEAARARLDWDAAHVTFFRLEGVAFVGLGAFIFATLQSLRLRARPL